MTAARTGSQNSAIQNLKQAVKLDPSLLKRAQNDLEFTGLNLSYIQ